MFAELSCEGVNISGLRCLVRVDSSDSLEAQRDEFKEVKEVQEIKGDRGCRCSIAMGLVKVPQGVVLPSSAEVSSWTNLKNSLQYQ